MTKISFLFSIIGSVFLILPVHAEKSVQIKIPQPEVINTQPEVSCSKAKANVELAILNEKKAIDEFRRLVKASEDKKTICPQHELIWQMDTELERALKEWRFIDEGCEDKSIKGYPLSESSRLTKEENALCLPSDEEQLAISCPMLKTEVKLAISERQKALDKYKQLELEAPADKKSICAQYLVLATKDGVLNKALDQWFSINEQCGDKSFAEYSYPLPPSVEKNPLCSDISDSVVSSPGPSGGGDSSLNNEEEVVEVGIGGLIGGETGGAVQ